MNTNQDNLTDRETIPAGEKLAQFDETVLTDPRGAGVNFTEADVREMIATAKAGGANPTTAKEISFWIEYETGTIVPLALIVRLEGGK